jgi:hypothetical protein
VFAHGSYARGEETPTSDLDLHAVTLGETVHPYTTWFVGDLHVSIGFSSARRVREARARPAEWSLRFAVDSPGVWVWSTAAAVAALGDPPDLDRPPDEAELEDFVEWSAKALRAEDPLTLRVAARAAGEEAPALLRDLNAPERVRNRVGAVRAALGYRTAPEGWSDDLPVLLGFAPADDDAVRRAVERTARGLLALLRERRSTVGDAQPELTRYLHDGTLERHLGFE